MDELEGIFSYLVSSAGQPAIVLLDIFSSFDLSTLWFLHQRMRLVIAMEYLRSWFKSRLPRPGPSPSAVPSFQITCPKIYHITTLLPDLPLKLLLEVSYLLPIVDLKCLSLCNRRLYELFPKNDGHSALALTRAEKLSILARLERDLLEYFACYVCQKLHRYDGTESFGLSGVAHKKASRLPCDNKGYKWWEEVSAGTTMSLGTHIDFGHSRSRLSHHQLKLAMRRYRLGPMSGINPDSLSYTQVRFYCHPLRVIPWYPPAISPFIPTLFSMEAQICPEPLGLYVRMQDIILYDTWEDSKLESNPISIYRICFHATLSSKMCDLDTLENGIKDSYLDYICPRCNTACVIEILQVEPESKIALIMTRWIYLGLGLDQEDPLWRIWVSWSSAPRPDQLPQSMMTQSPRLCYENQSPETFEQLRVRNLSYLTKGKYNKEKPLVRLGSLWTWYIPYKEPSK